jgi:hypothetical protein
MSSKVWWALRGKFRQSIPNPVGPEFLATFLDTTEESVTGNVLRPLKAIGLVDQENKATELARRWREDDEYPSVCEEIRSNIYPSELLEALPGTNPDRNAVERWFARRTGQGSSAVGQMAAFYILLSNATVQDSVEATSTATRAPTDRRKSKQESSSKSRVPKAGRNQEESVSRSPSTDGVSSSTLSPTLHIDIQVHISSDASADQIDQIFKSMATHLYRSNTSSERWPSKAILGPSQGNPEGGRRTVDSSSRNCTPTRRACLVPPNLYYIEKVIDQINVSYSNACYDSCAVMIRRLIETLIIEVFEHFQIQSQIKNSSGDYVYLEDLINLTLACTAWNLSRNTKKALPRLKRVGDLSAHNRRYIAHRNDIDKIRDDLRITAQELVLLAILKWWKRLSKMESLWFEA